MLGEEGECPCQARHSPGCSAGAHQPLSNDPAVSAQPMASQHSRCLGLITEILYTKTDDFISTVPILP